MTQRPEDDDSAQDGSSEPEQDDFESTRRRDRWQLWTLAVLLVLMVAEIVFLVMESSCGHRHRKRTIRKHPMTGKSDPPATPSWHRAFGPWWAWIGVLMVTTSSLFARGLDFSSPAATAWTVFSLLGVVLAVVLILARFLWRKRGAGPSRHPDDEAAD